MKPMNCALAALSTVSVLSVVGTAFSDEYGSMDRIVAITEIVSDQPGEARVTDPTLVNAWGLAFLPAGIARVVANENGVANAYDANGNRLRAPITLPSIDEASPAAPTGEVFNADGRAFAGDRLIFVTEDGTISGWQRGNGNEAVLRVDNSEKEAIYKGVTIARDSKYRPRLFATDFHNAKVDVFDSNYDPVRSRGFEDQQLPSGFAPFNIQEVHGALVVTYAQQDEDQEDDVAGPGKGFVDLFDVDGSLIARLVSRGELNAPWGIALSPASFSPAPNRLLIGNFGDGKIHVYDFDLSRRGAPRAVLEGALQDSAGKDVALDGLWALSFAPDAGSFKSSQLYYTAGPDDETHGVFGRIEASDHDRHDLGDTNGNRPRY